jgi:hypothetical protein
MGLLGGTIAVLLLAWGFVGRDHFGAIPLKGDYGWYQNWGEWTSRRVQDRDIFYHRIGGSVDAARKADIIVLGHSMMNFGLQHDAMRVFAERHGLKIYNLASPGDASGEFVRLIIRRWSIEPGLWIINADDHAANFFNVSLDDFGSFGRSAPASVVGYGWLTGYLNVAGRNMLWRLQDFGTAHFPIVVANAFFPGKGRRIWRRIDDGNYNLDEWPAFMRTDNAAVSVGRDQKCPTNPEEVIRARRYIEDIGGETVLTLVPYHSSCPQRVRELGHALGLDVVIPPTEDYTSWDGGGHLDKNGAIRFTRFLFSNLEQTSAFERLLASKRARAPDKFHRP